MNKAIVSALGARKEWDLRPVQDRAEVFFKAADILSGPRRAEILAKTMVGQVGGRGAGSHHRWGSRSPAWGGGQVFRGWERRTPVKRGQAKLRRNVGIVFKRGPKGELLGVGFDSGAVGC